MVRAFLFILFDFLKQNDSVGDIRLKVYSYTISILRIDIDRRQLACKTETQGRTASTTTVLRCRI
jgi:hypothetical protein